jgi:hypothetical protein
MGQTGRWTCASPNRARHNTTASALWKQAVETFSTTPPADPERGKTPCIRQGGRHAATLSFLGLLASIKAYQFNI